MLNIVQELLIIGAVSNFIVMLVIRCVYRLHYGINVFDWKVNLSVTSRRKFRVIELLPVFGTIFTYLKNRTEKDDNSGYAYLVEIMTFMLVPPVIMFTNGIILPSFIIVMIVGSAIIHLVQCFNESKQELSETLAIQNKKQSRFQSRFNGYAR